MWDQGVHTEQETMANKPDTVIKNKKKENVDTHRCGKARRQKCHAKGKRKEIK